jgi:hypothetical protein
MLKNPEIAGILKACNLDPMKDLDSVTIAGRFDFMMTKKAVILVRGKFDENKIVETAKAGAKDGKYTFSTTKEGSFSVHEVKGEHGDPAYLIFTDKNTIAASPSKEYLLEVAGGKTGKLDAQMAKALSKATGKESMFASAIITDDLKKLAAANPAIEKLVAKLEYATLSFILSDGAKYTLTVQTADAETAAGLKLAMGIGLPTAKKQIKDQGGPGADIAIKMIDKIKVTTDKSALIVSLDLDAAMIEELQKQFPGGK